MSSAELARGQMGFDLIAVLAVSAMAQVELCRVSEGEPRGAIVAVKRLPHDVVEDDELRRMFQDEIWLAAAIDHPNVARVLAWGEDDRGPYLVSEFVQGVPLKRLMRTVFNTGEHFTERLVVSLAAAVGAGLAAAHEVRGADGEFLGLVHRELTPGNVLLGFDGAVKITDFGLAKAKQRVTFTAVGKTKGDPAYMSPEQVLGQPLDGRSDIFALGVLMYELLAKELPWRVRSVSEALRAIVHGPPPDLARACPRLDPALVAVVNRCLAKSADDRYPTVHLLRGELDRWLELHGYGDSRDHLARFVRRNAMRQMRWLERVLSGETHFDPRGESLYGGSDPEGSGHSEVEPGAMGRVVGPDDEPAPPLPGPPSAAVSTERRIPMAIDDPETVPTGRHSRTIEDPESASTTIDRPPARARVGTVTLAAHRPRDADPPWGATTASTVAYARPSSTGESGEAHLLAKRIIEVAEGFATSAREAAESARVAVQQAEEAALRADRAAEAVELVRDAVRAVDAGQTDRARELLRQASDIFEPS